MPGLDELFEDTGVTEPEAPQEPEEPEAEAPEEPPKEEPKEPEKPSEPPSEEKDERVPVAALQEERRKRQEYERRLREYEQQKEKKPEEKKDFWEAPEDVINQRVESVAKDLESKFTVRFLRSSEARARKQYEDYDAKIRAFQEAVESNPQLYQQMLDSEDPAEFAYKVGETYEYTKDAPTIDALEKKLEAKLEAKLREKLEKEYAEKYGKENLQKVPESLTDETGKTSRAKADPNVSPLDEIFKD